jgi:hypothetical protein
MRTHLIAATFLFTLFMLAVTPAAAQHSGGDVHGRAVDEYDKGLPDIALALEGNAFRAEVASGTGGRFLFRDVPPGTYRVSASGPGVATAQVLDVTVRAGRSVDLTVVMKAVRRPETITTLAGLPALDRRRGSTGTLFTREEREAIPRPLDAWSVHASTPALVDGRLDPVGGDGAPPPAVQSRGARPTDTIWYLDGVELPSASVAGAIPRHAGVVDEIAVSTAGHDLRHAAGGAAVNLVTRRAGDRWRGSARGSFAFGGDDAGADHLDDAIDYGFEAGGPAMDGRLWFWGAVGHDRVRAVRDAPGRLEPQAVERSVTSAAARLDWHASPSDRVDLSWTSAFTEDLGRAPGDQPDEADASTWNQRDWRDGAGPPGLLKIEGHHVFARGASLTARYAHVGGGLRLDPRGGLDAGAGSSFLANRTFGSTRAVRLQHPQHTGSLDGSWLAGAHDVRFGLAYRRLMATEETIWPGGGVQALVVSSDDRRARVHSGAAGRQRVERWSAYLGDSFEWQGLVAAAALRYDRQGGRALPSDVPANAAFPDLAPAVTFEGYDAPFTWRDLSPRVGLVYTLDAVRRTLVRLGLSRYTGRLSPFEVGYASPAAMGVFTDYRWNDLDADSLAQAGEVVTSAPLASGATFGTGEGLGGLPLAIDEELEAPRTTEFVAAFEHELRPGLTVGLTYAYQRQTDFQWQPRTGRGEYLGLGTFTGTLPDGAPYDVPFFEPLTNAGRILANRPGYHQSHHGLELQAVRRLSDGWMLRLAAALGSHREFLDTPRTFTGNPTPLDTDPLVDHGHVAARVAGGDGSEAFLNRRWMVSLSGLWRLPYEFDLSGHLLGRQGLADPLFRPVSLGVDGPQRVSVSGEANAFRHDDVWTLDLRLSRAVRLGRATAVVDADVLNLFDSRTALTRVRNLSTGAGGITRQLSPRVARLGLRLGF